MKSYEEHVLEADREADPAHLNARPAWDALVFRYPLTASSTRWDSMHLAISCANFALVIGPPGGLK